MDSGTALAVQVKKGEWALAHTDLALLFDALHRGKYLTFGNQYAEFLVKVCAATAVAP